MAQTTDIDIAVRDDPRFREGLRHMQAGRWAEAEGAFQALTEQYPTSAHLRRVLDEARFKARFDEKNKVTPVRSTVNVWPWVLRVLLLALLGVAGYFGVPYARDTLIPRFQAMRTEQRRADLLAQGQACLKEGDFACAEERFQALLAEVPDQEDAQAGLQVIEDAREIERLYTEGVAQQDQGNLTEALELLKELNSRLPNYRDVPARIASMERSKAVEDLFAEAEANRQAGKLLEALEQYKQIRAMNLSYRRETITSRLYELYFSLGADLITGWPVDRAAMQQALSYFSEALSVRPREPEAVLERDLLTLYLNGEDRYYAGRWDEAALLWERLYAQVPEYLDMHLVEVLYDALVQSGNAHMASSDYYFAYNQYMKASLLPVADTTLAQKGLADFTALGLPTPTPAPTASPVPVVTRRPGMGGTARATPQPGQVDLREYTGRIVFLSDHPQQPGVWAMNPDGTNKQYLGSTKDLQKQFTDLEEAARLAPTGDARLFVRNVERGSTSIAQVFVWSPSGEKQLTDLNGLCYDPVWSPDGQTIAFVSQHTQSDDIWVLNLDGTGLRNLNVGDESAAWDKHPAWSPDGDLIAFWSSRTGRRQVHVMAADGTGVRNISNAPWDEYDPIWVR